ncbi:MinD/ParA family ATP-binding protein [Lignipirellula cremea]|uniref:Flagellum site-determining protein YlxH n=1 Tax=Lignipirellula cremea TaxID=2528010 RepID=A0A518E2C5_9BACT|nr:P-loop NTPase [Lignipirellula cremea]QDU98240.1 Flagellum site-determining protein YlxH [Lignipirellula cremea]
MPDQAAELRSLMRNAEQSRPRTNGPAAPILVVQGGKGGVGATWLSVNLAIGLALQGGRTVLVDANLNHADAASYCGVQDRDTIAEVMRGERDLREVLQPGPAGLLVAAGAWAPSFMAEASDRMQQRLVDQIRTLGSHAERIVVDLGAGTGPLARKFWQAADQALVVATPDTAALMDSYATIKTLHRAGQAEIGFLVNQAKSSAEADELFARLERSCRRFLNTPITSYGDIPSDPLLPSSIEQGEPLLLLRPQADASAGIQRLASRIFHRSLQEAA